MVYFGKPDPNDRPPKNVLEWLLFFGVIVVGIAAAIGYFYQINPLVLAANAIISWITNLLS